MFLINFLVRVLKVGSAETQIFWVLEMSKFGNRQGNCFISTFSSGEYEEKIFFLMSLIFIFISASRNNTQTVKNHNEKTQLRCDTYADIWIPKCIHISEIACSSVSYVRSKLLVLQPLSAPVHSPTNVDVH